MMFKQLTTILALMAGSLAFCQVGIGTTTPHASTDLELGSANKALLLNRVANTAAVANPVNGMLIYDLEAKCAKVYQGEPLSWSRCLDGSAVGPGTGTIGAFSCGAATFSPSTATQGTAYNGHLEIPYTGGNGGSYEAQSFTSNGLTFTLTAGNLATGDGLVRYNITGTPTNSGTTYVEISLGGKSCGGANAMALSVNTSVPTNPQGPSSGATGGNLTGKACFDVAQNNDGAECGPLASRQAQRADFTQTSTNTQIYTFRPTGTVSNVRFAFVNTNGAVISSISGGNPGTGITGPVLATVTFLNNLNITAAGLSRNNALKADIYVIYTDNTNTDRQLKLTAKVQDCNCCGAYIAAGVWKEFMCHNLGADESLDLFTPAAGIHGAKYQWGRFPALVTQADDQANSGGIFGFNTTAAGNGAWNDAVKTVNDPCPAGYRVPTLAQWQGVMNNNTMRLEGTWTPGYLNAVHFGSGSGSLAVTLTLPITGHRSSSSSPPGTITNRGTGALYWSSSIPPATTTNASGLVLSQVTTGALENLGGRLAGTPVRCIAE